VNGGTGKDKTDKKNEKGWEKGDKQSQKRRLVNQEVGREKKKKKRQWGRGGDELRSWSCVGGCAYWAYRGRTGDAIAWGCWIDQIVGGKGELMLSIFFDMNNNRQGGG